MLPKQVARHAHSDAARNKTEQDENMATQLKGAIGTTSHHAGCPLAQQHASTHLTDE